MDEKISGRVLRTVLKDELYDKLELFAKSLSTGYGKWDFGVAIERLLDLMKHEQRLDELEQRIQDLEVAVIEQPVKQEQDNKPVKVDEEVLLGKHHLDKEKK